MREISILGVTVEDCSLREALRSAYSLLSQKGLNTICYLDTALLMKAKDNEELKNAIHDMDLLIPGNVEILRAGGINTLSREKEVSGNFFLRELIKRLAKEKKKIFLLADSQDDLVHLREQLLKIDSRLRFFGSYAFLDLTGTEDAIINEINAVIPDVIISQSSSYDQEIFLNRSKSMTNCGLWIVLQPGSTIAPAAKVMPTKRNAIIDFFERRIFRRAVNSFDDSEE